MLGVRREALPAAPPGNIASSSSSFSPAEVIEGLRQSDYLGNGGHEEGCANPPIHGTETGDGRQNGRPDQGRNDAHNAADRVQGAERNSLMARVDRLGNNTLQRRPGSKTAQRRRN
jgi:hypothetical protein